MYVKKSKPVGVAFVAGPTMTTNASAVWRRLLLCSMIALIVMIADPGLAQTGSSDIFSSVQSKTSDIFTNVRNILMVVGALGVLGLAASAFFGHFKWSWAVSLLGGLALIAFVSQIITYFGLTAPTSTGQ
jgi:hypothetical protein